MMPGRTTYHCTLSGKHLRQRISGLVACPRAHFVLTVLKVAGATTNASAGSRRPRSSALCSGIEPVAGRRGDDAQVEELRCLRRRDNTDVASLVQRTVLSHISPSLPVGCPFGPVLAPAAKPLADCLLVFAPVVRQHSLADAEPGPVSGSFLNVAAEAL